MLPPPHKNVWDPQFLKQALTTSTNSFMAIIALSLTTNISHEWPGLCQDGYCMPTIAGTAASGLGGVVREQNRGGGMGIMFMTYATVTLKMEYKIWDFTPFRFNIHNT